MIRLTTDTAPYLDGIDRDTPDWTGALCADADAELWFPERGQSASIARAVCAACPLRDTCLNYALPRPDLVGIWGGTTAEERQAMRGLQKLEVIGRLPINHGTYGGYYVHRNRHEPPCDDCREAKRAGDRARAARQRETS